MITPMRVFVLCLMPELRMRAFMIPVDNRNKVLIFESEDDATLCRHAGAGFPTPQ